MYQNHCAGYTKEVRTIFYLIPAFAVIYALFSIIHETIKSSKTGTWKKIRTPNRTRKYIKKKIILDNKHCVDLPKFDSRGVFTGISGSFADKTGKFSGNYRKEMEELNESYGIPDE